ncbi:MAG TPA: hypothetical protein DHV17_01750 [Chitinophagaceae bacterium]|nr:hypothetical protein [Chitinophagaceae bacterium]
MRIFILLFLIVLQGSSAFSQNESIDAKEWARKLMDADDGKNLAARNLIMLLQQDFPPKHSIQGSAFPESFKLMRKLIEDIEKYADTTNPYFSARYKCIVSTALSYENHMSKAVPSNKEKVLALLNDAIDKAYEINDELLIAYVSQVNFALMKFYDEFPLAVAYGIYSAELYEKNSGFEEFTEYEYLSELMFRVREYDMCIAYCKKWLDMQPKGQPDELKKMFTLNTLALAYHRQSKHDSALFYYQEALKSAHTINRKDWDGIIKGNIGQVFYLTKQYDTAIQLLEYDYRTSLKHAYYDNAANSLQWSARAHSARGDHGIALEKIREAFRLIKRIPDQGYLQNIYFGAIDIYKLNGIYDSALHFAGLYQNLHDSIEKKINLSSIELSKVRMNEMGNLYNIRKLQLEKKTQKNQRNFAIAGIIFLTVLGIMLINRQRQKHKQKQALLEQEKEHIELEIASAQEQLSMFTQSIQEKSNLIERLEQQMSENKSSALQQEMLNEISEITILTEEDWDKFKRLFEKIYPLFFERLKAKAPDITMAEQRMAALTRLHLTARQMAAMLGISVDSVHKSRQRLRQRFGINTDVSLDEFITQI